MPNRPVNSEHTSTPILNGSRCLIHEYRHRRRDRADSYNAMRYTRGGVRCVRQTTKTKRGSLPLGSTQRKKERESARRAGQYAGEYTGSPCPRATRSIRSLARSSASSVIVRPLCSPAISAALSPSTMSTWHSPSRSRALLTHPPRDLSFDHKARSSRPACVAIPARGHALRVFFLPRGRSYSIFLPPNWVTLTFHRFAIFHTTLNTCFVLLYQSFRSHADQLQKFTSREK